VAVRLDLAENLPQVQVDPLQIEQVLLNLIRNAVDAMEATPANQRELWIRTYAGPRGMVCAGVRDTGPGLTPEVAEQVFGPFFTTKPAGTGLGLAISRTIIEDAHGGELWVKPDPRGGASAGFALPTRKGGQHARK
jgi:signal transduction histidine kinase